MFYPSRTEDILFNYKKKCWVCCHRNCSGCVIKRKVKELVFSKAEGTRFRWTNPNTPKLMHLYICNYRRKLKADRLEKYVLTPAYKPTPKAEPPASVRRAMTHPCSGGSMSSK